VRRPGLDGSCWPDPTTELLLGAAVLPEAEAVERWRRVRPAVDGDVHLLSEHQRLLPMVLATIGEEGAGDDAARMKRAHREAWRDNQLHIHHAGRWLDPLGRAEIPVMVLKGMALAQDVYPDVGCRPMSDVDVLVPSPQFDAALARLVEAGWIGADGRRVDRALHVRHALPLVHPEGGHIDLHHSPGTPFMGGARRGVSVPEMWAARRPARLGDRPVTVPAPEDLLLTVIVHGLTSFFVWSSRWVVDSIVLLRSTEPDREVDWERLAEQARRHHVVLPARSALRYLVDAFDAPVPPDALWRLWDLPVSDGDRRRFDTVTGVVGGAAPWARTSNFRGYCARLRTALGPVHTALAMPRILADFVEVDQTSQLPGEIARRARGRLARAA
jgi:hypothetical protein